MKSYSIVPFLVCILLLALSACGPKATQRTLKLSHGLDTQHPVHLAMVRFGELLQSYSAGKLGLEIYPGEQLGSERQALELLQIGSLDITKVSAAVLENFAPDMRVFNYPYLFRDDVHVREVLFGEVGKDLLTGMDAYRIRGLTYFDAGKRSFYTTKRPVKSPDDLRGLKIRVQESPTAMQLVRDVGASPTPVSWGELYTALQQGVVDGAENNLSSFFLSRHYEVCKNLCINEHTIIPDVLLVGTVTWNRLSPQEREWVQVAADSAAIYQRELWKASENRALEAIQKAGVRIEYPDKAAFAEKTLAGKAAAPERVKQLIQQIQQVGDE